VAEIDALLYKLRCYRDPQRIRSDVLELIKNTPSLQPRSGSLARGPTQSVILYLAGTVPIFYNGAQYNIPVNIWMIEQYPFSPPICYVTPTPGMIIKPKHRHVDSAGMCYLPYLSNWNPNTHNLVGLVGTMAKVFGQDPPVRSQASSPPPSNPIPPPTSMSPPSSQPPNPPQNYPQSSVNQPNSTPNYPQQSYPQSGGGYPSNNFAQPFEDPATVAKRNAVTNVTAKIHERLHQFNIVTTKEVDDCIAQSADIEAKSTAIASEKNRLEEDKSRMDVDIDNLTKSFDELSKWLDDNNSVAVIDIDAVTEPRDPLSKQLLYLVGEEASIEDTMYYLEKKIISGHLDVETFLKSVRNLSTEQFIKRATIKKIHEKQRGR